MPRRAAPRARVALAGVALAVLAGCERADEAGMRARLEAWFAIGETRYFAARSDCAAGMFALVDDGVGAAMPVTGSVPQMRRTLARGGVAALDDPGQAPDAALVALANADRATGYALRRAALEGRACMDAAAEGAFRDALTAPAAMLAWDGASGTVMVLDRDAGLLLAAMGEG